MVNSSFYFPPVGGTSGGGGGAPPLCGPADGSPGVGGGGILSHCTDEGGMGRLDWSEGGFLRRGEEPGGSAVTQT